MKLKKSKAQHIYLLVEEHDFEYTDIISTHKTLLRAVKAATKPAGRRKMRIDNGLPYWRSLNTTLQVLEYKLQ